MANLGEELAGVRRSACWRLRRRVGDEPVHVRGDAGHEGRWCRDVLVEMLVEDVGDGVADDGLAPGEQLKEDQPRGVDIGAGGRLGELDLLGRDVGQRAQDVVADGGGRCARHGTGQAEIGHLDDAVGADDDVLRFDVAMDKPGFVGDGEGLEHRVEQIEGRARS